MGSWARLDPPLPPALIAWLAGLASRSLVVGAGCSASTTATVSTISTASRAITTLALRLWPRIVPLKGGERTLAHVGGVERVSRVRAKDEALVGVIVAEHLYIRELTLQVLLKHVCCSRC
jgi:hypothetical protein